MSHFYYCDLVVALIALVFIGGIMFKNAFSLLSGALVALTLLGATGSGIAQTVPHSLVASPDVYKVIAENEQYRVIEVTWKAGQRDQMHSHPASAVYYPMDCTLSGFDASGAAHWTRQILAGTAMVQKPILAHSLENTGQSVCKLIMFEPK